VTGAVGRHDSVAAKLRPKKRKGPARREPNERPYPPIVGVNAPSCNYAVHDFYGLPPDAPIGGYRVRTDSTPPSSRAPASWPKP
jgi:hypothetical protein